MVTPGSLAALSIVSQGECRAERAPTANSSSTAYSSRTSPLATKSVISGWSGVTIEFGQAMGLRVGAERIEDRQTLDLLRDLGCDLGQGYVIGRPVPADRLSFRSDATDAPAGALTG